MIGYTTLGTNDLQNSGEFYDQIFNILGGARAFDEADFIAWGQADGAPMFSIHLPHDKNPATVGNGVMIALRADNKDQVSQIHAKVLALGGVDEGAPGYRMDGFYAAYFRDLDGNKLNIHYLG
jgi:catechol 2,3-dioxygenase-like lactoylglutathione lyase family enzyme